MTNTNIEWTDATWNPVRGCTVVSEGCRNCYAMKQAHRFSGPGQPYEGLTEIGNHGPRWNGNIQLVPEVLDAPTRWKKPRRIFVNSMSDLFHEDVPDEFIDQVFAVMALTPQHTYQVLTKRPERMRLYCSGTDRPSKVAKAIDVLEVDIETWPLPNCWKGVSIEDQHTADKRIPILLRTPAAVRWISAEPLLGPTDLSRYLIGESRLNWVVVGGES